ncbi:MAG: xanthine dehydrogenase [Candidatus Cloacimonetes bacterium HGW-Cloacimonetes-2]|jgi:carbon-monoxide dehydrogenase small subunit|nr:MAG: xanthine dehydrogenase [Candidatus Cloacimonetes bacterium HGW-Cloacimonetes-2]
MKTIVNGREYTVAEQSLDKSLVYWLREDLGLTGTKIGCDIGVCGTCTILLNMQAVRSCKLKVKDAIDKEILTIEGVQAPDGSLHPIQQAFIDQGAIQCGFCTPGMVLSALALLSRNPNPSRIEIRKAINANLCRCTGYQQIIDAVEQAARMMKTHSNTDK